MYTEPIATRAKMRQWNILVSFCKQIMIFYKMPGVLKKDMVNIMVFYDKSGLLVIVEDDM